MVIALLLAQLVLPGPPSGPIQPPGMICASGGCEGGPVVYRTSAGKSRLVVACDMRSDTCSDGRRITTTRSTPVPCETSPGVWEIVPADQGCYSVRGLESWAQNTSYLSYGAELDRSPWRVAEGATLAKQDGFYRISGVNSSSRVLQAIALPEEGVWTLSCIMRTSGSQNPRLRIYPGGATGGGFCDLDSSDAFSTYSCTKMITGTPTAIGAHVYTGIGHIDVQGCWITKTSTPGRPCWGGEAPVTCGADVTSISTEGWPTESGEICLTATVSRTDTAVILDGRPGWISQGPLLAMQPSGTIRWESDGVRINSHVVAREVPHLVCAGRRDGKLTLSVDGVSVPPIDGPPLAWEPVAVLGDSNGGTSQHIDGSISSIRVRSFE